MEGALQKKSKSGALSARPFKLVGQNLQWLGSDKKKENSVSLVDAKVTDIKFGPQKFTFEVTFKNAPKPIILVASGEAEKQAWIAAITAAAIPKKGGPAAAAAPGTAGGGGGPKPVVPSTSNNNATITAAPKPGATTASIPAKPAGTPNAPAAVPKPVGGPTPAPTNAKPVVAATTNSTVKPVTATTTPVVKPSVTSPAPKPGVSSTTATTTATPITAPKSTSNAAPVTTTPSAVVGGAAKPAIATPTTPSPAIVKPTDTTTTQSNTPVLKPTTTSTTTIPKPSTPAATVTLKSTPSQPSEVRKLNPVSPPAPRPNCVVCGKLVNKFEEVVLDTLVIHKGCFKCSVCKTSLSAGNFAVVNTSYYCKQHYEKLFTKTEEEVAEPPAPPAPATTPAEISSKPPPATTGIPLQLLKAAAAAPPPPSAPPPPPQAPTTTINIPTTISSVPEPQLAPPPAPEPERTVMHAMPAAMATGFAMQAMKARQAQLAKQGADVPQEEETQDTSTQSTAPGELSHSAALARPKMAGGRRAPKREEIGKLLPKEQDRMTHDWTFRMSVDGSAQGPNVLWLHATSKYERDHWITTLSLAIHKLELTQETLREGGDIETAKLNLDTFMESQPVLTYSGWLEKLSMKSHRNWKRRWFQLGEDALLRYFVDDKAKKSKQDLVLTPMSKLLSAEGEVLNEPLVITLAIPQPSSSSQVQNFAVFDNQTATIDLSVIIPEEHIKADEKEEEEKKNAEMATTLSTSTKEDETTSATSPADVTATATTTDEVVVTPSDPPQVVASHSEDPAPGLDIQSVAAVDPPPPVVVVDDAPSPVVVDTPPTPNVVADAPQPAVTAAATESADDQSQPPPTIVNEQPHTTPKTKRKSVKNATSDETGGDATGKKGCIVM